MAEIKIDEWNGCYPSQWKGLIVPGAMSHPAKFSSKLIRRIYDHMVEEGWLRIGDRVIDPFGGVALGALEAMRHGLWWQGIELEAKFVRLGHGFDCPGISKREWVRWQNRLSRNKDICPDCQAGTGSAYQGNGIIPETSPHRFQGNIDLWNKKFSRMPHWGRAQLTQGDSRFILKILSGQSGVVSSPPYTDSLSTDLLTANERVKVARERGISNAEFISPIDMEKLGMRHQTDYGSTPGQLGAMQPGDFSAAITSPPFRQSEGGTPEPKPGGAIDERLYARHAAGNSAADGYGTTPGNLANMDEPKDDFEGAVSSPPYEATILSGGGGIAHEYRDTYREGQNYGDSDQNLGHDSGETFWQAARQIVEQVYLALLPGGKAVWVVKNYVKNKQIVPFCDQWRQLCESVGFITLHEHHAMLVHNKGTSHTLEGGTVEHKTESKSFFRRLAEKNGSPRIDYEVVFCMVKE